MVALNKAQWEQQKEKGQENVEGGSQSDAPINVYVTPADQDGGVEAGEPTVNSPAEDGTTEEVSSLFGRLYGLVKWALPCFSSDSTPEELDTVNNPANGGDNHDL